jgi:hypothetical protein
MSPGDLAPQPAPSKKDDEMTTRADLTGAMILVTWTLNGKRGSWQCATAKSAENLIAALRGKGATEIQRGE